MNTREMKKYTMNSPLHISTHQHYQENPHTCRLTGTEAGMCTLELVIEAGIATGMVCPLGRCNKRGKGPGTGLRIKKKQGSHLKNKLTTGMRYKGKIEKCCGHLCKAKKKGGVNQKVTIRYMFLM